jgi:hypothetical protein
MLKGPLSPSTVNHITDSSGIPRTFATGLMSGSLWANKELVKRDIAVIKTREKLKIINIFFTMVNPHFRVQDLSYSLAVAAA